jgi:hypothetical protein
MKMASDTCAHCPREAAEHAAAEREGVVRHKFSRDGELNPVDPATVGKPEKKEGAALPQPIQGLPLGDPVLRFVLIQAGVITPEQLTEAERTLLASGMLKTDVRHT